MSLLSRTSAALSVLLAACFAVIPGVAFACPVCFSAQNEENRAAFVLMTVFLTLLPLGMLGLGMGWAWRRLRAQDHAVAAPAPVDVVGPDRRESAV